jgi:S1-C subfamily serine protease
VQQRIVLKHVTGSKANQTEEFPIQDFKELTIGRDPAAGCKFDPDRDDLVSRLHAKIVKESDSPLQFAVVDLESRNGTMVNDQRVFKSARLNPGDTVQLGPAGPSFLFLVEPPPPRPTRSIGDISASGERKPVPSTREAATPVSPVTPATATPITPFTPAHEPRPVSRSTMERLIGQVSGQSRRAMWITGMTLTVLVIILLAVLYMYWGRIVNPPGFDVIARQNADAVVLVEVGWKLVDTSTGRQLHHSQILYGDRKIPVYTLSDGKIQPILINTDESGQHRPIGGQVSGTGFVVSSDGFIVANRHVAAAWETAYVWPADMPDGFLVDENGGLVREVRAVDLPRDWVPANTAAVVDSISYNNKRRTVVPKPSKAKNMDGRLDYLDVTFASTKSRARARLIGAADAQDVALVKVDLPRRLNYVTLFSEYEAAQEANAGVSQRLARFFKRTPPYETVRQGDAAMVMAYPAVSPDTVARDPQQRTIPEPTVSVGNVARIYRAGATVRIEQVPIEVGDSYQLTMGSMGTGSSGGPVFDQWGRVFALLFFSRTTADSQANFAVPIRFAVDIMNLGRAQ